MQELPPQEISWVPKAYAGNRILLFPSMNGDNAFGKCCDWRQRQPGADDSERYGSDDSFLHDDYIDLSHCPDDGVTAGAITDYKLR